MNEVIQLTPGTNCVRDDVRVFLTREPWGDTFTLNVLRDGRKSSEELEPDETRAWFKARGITNVEALEKALDECWNFYQTVIVIPAHVYRDPVLPFPRYQPKLDPG